MKTNIFWLVSCCLIFLLTLLPKNVLAGDYQVGVYYFPGWRDLTLHSPAAHPWDSIKLYPERKPKLGWYAEGDQSVADRQIFWMKKYGIDFVVYDWYFADHQVYLDHAINAYLASSKRKGLKFSIMLANNDSTIASKSDWTKIVSFWIQKYFSDKQYLKMDNKPVVVIADVGTFSSQVAAFNATPEQLFRIAHILARRAGLNGIYFVGATGAYLPTITTTAKSMGYSALTGYNYHASPDASVLSHSFAELDYGYQQHWQRFLEKSSLPYIVPMTSGWDKRPWGGSKDSLHDNSYSDPLSFKNHITAARQFMDSNPVLTKKTGIICCWNEYGEGSYIEPTVAYESDYLQAVSDVFTSN